VTNIVVGPACVMNVAAERPNRTRVAAVMLLPKMVIVVPPPAGPDETLNPVTTGLG
jgi:hypothetical protein